ncbi:MAG: IPT/TIG domain-containing protein [Treponema sp.]|jgi:transglutaminase-like putative cysteine protease|nr:IPT/TIG domain-containing protein [Treponema sp.]
MRRFFLQALPLLASALLLFACEDRYPRIDSIDPRIGMMGEVLTIIGENFGDAREESSVTIAGITPTASSYIEWSDNRIKVRVPEFGDSGLVCVYRNSKKSNGALFSNRQTMPQTVQEEYTGIGPRINVVEPQSGVIGSAVTIRGSGFGASREGGGVFFAWDAESPPGAPAEANGPGEVEVSETEFGYELWNEREIRVRVPDGAIGGSLTVRTPRGDARPMFFDVAGRPGTKTFKDKRTYAISYSVDIKVEKAEEPNSLYLWLPRPVASSSQRNARLLSRTAEPFIENYRGASLFQMKNLQSGAVSSVSLSYLVEVYAVETDIRANSLAIGSRTSPVMSAYTASNDLIPSDNPRVRELAATVAGREQNPYLKARRIYEYLLNEVAIQWTMTEGGPPEAPIEKTLPGVIAEKRADPYMAALLFCALCRAAGVPAVPVSGVLMDRNRMGSSHYWAEFWVDGFGWVPVDPALGGGAAPPSFVLRADRTSYYFGSLDNQRVSFSRGFTALSPMDPRSRVSVRERGYALQSLWEEAAGGLEAYSSLWSDVIINGVYYQ